MSFKIPLLMISKCLQADYSIAVSQNDRVLYSTDLGDIAFGILLERSPYARSIFLRRFTFPMFLYMDGIHLVYSKRLLNIQSSTVIFEGSARKITSDVVSTLQATGMLAQLSQRYSAEQFLIEHGSQTRDRGALAHALTRVQLFDLAAAATLVGDPSLADLYMGACEDHLRKIHGKLPAGDPFPSEVHALSSALKTDPAAAVRLLERHAAANAVRLGFHPRPLDVGGKR